MGAGPLENQQDPGGTGVIHIRNMTPHDIDRGLELCRLANFNQVREDWQYFLNHASVFVAHNDTQVLGTCAVLDPQGPVAWIAMMLVDPAARRQSIGTRLFEHTLAHTQAPSIGLDATALGKPLYEKYGFIETAQVLRMKKEAPNNPSSGRPAPWRAGHASNQIGPLIASSLDHPQSQVLGALSTNLERSWIIDVPTAAPPEWRGWLATQGFIPQRPLSRMYRGQPQPLPAHLLATAGPEYGHHARSDAA